MDKQQLQQFEHTITERREQLRQDVLEHLQEADDNNVAELYGRVHDSGEESIADLLSDMNFINIEQEAREVAALEAALQRIHSGTYGRCVDCGDEIEMERLKANPAADRCFDCQNRKEFRGEDTTPSL
jgi:RNA polymerase-binding protein DksA